MSEIYGYPVKLAIYPPGHIHEQQVPAVTIDLPLTDVSTPSDAVPRFQLDLKAIIERITEAQAAAIL